MYIHTTKLANEACNFAGLKTQTWSKDDKDFAFDITLTGKDYVVISLAKDILYTSYHKLDYVPSLKFGSSSLKRNATSPPTICEPQSRLLLCHFLT